MSAHFLRACLDQPNAQPNARWALYDEASGRVVAATLLTAFDRDTRNRGLLGRDGLPTDQALVLAPCSSVHTFFMRFPIDILFVSRDGVVLRIRRAVRPWRLAARLGAFAVIEMAAGAATDTQVGDRLSVRPA